ncbi:hypothetical protein CEXT_506871 [Caerostris extrusa]|uniref:Uncharacterized protein n=1 Tax=Caerostris extrusa TaxID=172846 RepID=A0AAV4TMB1_CAEEX|nr:hypothetical protein CEXT_506871 [Caerostris extrusa]
MLIIVIQLASETGVDKRTKQNNREATAIGWLSFRVLEAKVLLKFEEGSCLASSEAASNRLSICCPPPHFRGRRIDGMHFREKGKGEKNSITFLVIYQR